MLLLSSFSNLSSISAGGFDFWLLLFFTEICYMVFKCDISNISTQLLVVLSNISTQLFDINRSCLVCRQKKVPFFTACFHVVLFKPFQDSLCSYLICVGKKVSITFVRDLIISIAWYIHHETLKQHYMLCQNRNCMHCLL